MSFSRAAGPILATVCGVCTAYAAFGPEFQRQAAERQFSQQHPDPATQPVQTSAAGHPQPQVIIDNDASIGATVKETLQQTKTEVAPKSAWSGLGLFRGVFGGAESPKAKDGGSADSKSSDGQSS
ncbi:hypothetical protein MBLNU459_g6395t1 [Dothideomycetes sp. NU459]